MASRDSNTHTGRPHGKQLQGIDLDAVLEKKRLDQALNVKEFAVCAGLSYSTARHWFHLPGFPALRGFIFWQDFVKWRTAHLNPSLIPTNDPGSTPTTSTLNLPPKASRLLLDF